MPCPHQSSQTIHSLDAMRAFAMALAPQLQAGDILALNGTLGAGKTTLTRLLAEAIGLQESVTSPTFVLMHEYETGPMPVIHADLYRLGQQGANAFVEELLDLHEARQAITLIEWAEYAPALDAEITVSLTIECLDPQETDEARRIVIDSNRPILFAL